MQPIPLTAVKIDKFFTVGRPNHTTSHKIVMAFADLADPLDLTCTVEGSRPQSGWPRCPMAVTCKAV